MTTDKRLKCNSHTMCKGWSKQQRQRTKQQRQRTKTTDKTTKTTDKTTKTTDKDNGQNNTCAKDKMVKTTKTTDKRTNGVNVMKRVNSTHTPHAQAGTENNTTDKRTK
jgi:hypothetical protein